MRGKMTTKTAALIALFCLLFSGCGSGFFYPDFLTVTPSPSPEPSETPVVLPDQKPGVHTFGIPFSPVESFKPLRDTYRYNSDVTKLCYEGLVELDRNFNPQYVLADTIQTEDNITYTITLNPNARFAGGSPLTPEDVVYSYNQARAEGGPYTERLRSIAGVTAIEGGVVITMVAPVFAAVSLMDIPIVQKDTDDRISVGTGPYSIYLEEEDTFLLQNLDWWRKTGDLPVSRIELIPVKGPGDLALGFGQTYISLMPMDVYDSLAPGIMGNCDKISYPTPLMQYIGFNMENKQLQSAEVRKAISMGIDRGEITQTVYGEYADPDPLPVPPSSAWYDETAAAGFACRPDDAALLLDGLGFTDRDGDGVREIRSGWSNAPFTLRFIVDTDSAYRLTAAKMAAESMRELGIDVDLQVLGWDAFLTAIETGAYDLYYAEALPLPNFSPRALMTEGGALNPGNVRTPELNEAVAALETAPAAEQQTALREVYRLIYEQAPLITICFRKMQVYSRFGLIEGLNPTYYNPYYEWKNIKINS